MVPVSISFFISLIVIKHALIAGGAIIIGYLFGFVGSFTRKALYTVTGAYFVAAVVGEVVYYLGVNL